jgi:hypothetical protein
MQYPNLFSTITLSLVITTLFLVHFPSSSYADNKEYLNYSVPFDCAGMKGLSYPFWGSNRPNYCGHPSFELNCTVDAPLIKITYMNYRILGVNEVSRTLMVAREDYWNTVCPATIVNTTINFTVFTYNSATTNLTLYYDCPASYSSYPSTDTIKFDCSINGSDGSNYYSSSTIGNEIATFSGMCKYNVEVPVLQSAAQTGSSLTEAGLVQAIDGGFLLGWDANNSMCDRCLGTGGQCGYNTSKSEFTCFGSGNYFVVFLASFLVYLFRCRLVSRSFCLFHFSKAWPL